MRRDTRYLELPSRSFGRYISVRTFRSDGSSSACPVWAAVDDGRVVFRTFANTTKARRLRRDGQVELASCDRSGRPAEGYVPGVAYQLRGRAAVRAWWRLLCRQGVALIFADLVYRRRLGAIACYAVVPASTPGPAQ